MSATEVRVEWAEAQGKWVAYVAGGFYPHVILASEDEAEVRKAAALYVEGHPEA